MQVPSIPGLTSGLASLAAFVRDRLAEVAPGAGSRWGRSDAAVALTDRRDELTRQLAVVVVAAAAPFAPTSYARARLLRQLHASGLLSDTETERAEQLLGVAQ